MTGDAWSASRAVSSQFMRSLYPADCVTDRKRFRPETPTVHRVRFSTFSGSGGFTTSPPRARHWLFPAWTRLILPVPYILFNTNSDSKLPHSHSGIANDRPSGCVAHKILYAFLKSTWLSHHFFVVLTPLILWSKSINFDVTHYLMILLVEALHAELWMQEWHLRELQWKAPPLYLLLCRRSTTDSCSNNISFCPSAPCPTQL
jgi:hypothetical protein